MNSGWFQAHDPAMALRLVSFLRHSIWSQRQFFGSKRDPVEVLRQQQQRLAHLLEVARTKSPFYREKFRHVAPGCTSLQEYPVTTKSEMMARFDEVVTDPEVRRAGVEEFIEDPENLNRLFLGRYHVSHTSGSLGQPTLIVQEPMVLRLLFALQMTRGNTSCRHPLAETLRRLLRPSRVAILISQQGFFPSAWVWKWLPPFMRLFVRFEFFAANDPGLIHKLNEFSPHGLSATPTTLDLLALKIDQLRLPELQQMVTWSETLTAGARKRIQAAFGVPLLDNYACGECLFLTNGCAAGPGAHINGDWAILEIVDEQNRPVPPGTLGSKVLLTNLANTLQPFIRYEVGDRLALATEPCGCGNRLPRIGQILGRSSDFFWVRSSAGYRPLTAYPFQHAFDYLREVREWQVEQVERNRVVVRLEPLPGAMPDLALARRRLQERLAPTGLLPEVDIAIETVPRLLADARTAKFRRLVSQVGAPSDLEPRLKELLSSPVSVEGAR